MRITLLLICLPLFESIKAQDSISFSVRTLTDVQQDRIQNLIEETDKLEAQNSILQTALDTNSSTFDGFSTYFTIISICLSIALIGVPVLGYFFVYRPNKKLRRRLKILKSEIPATISNSFTSKFNEIESSKFKQAFRELNQPGLFVQSLLFLHLNVYKKPDIEDQRILIEFLSRNPNLNTGDKDALVRFLSFYPSEIAEKYFRNELENSSDALLVSKHEPIKYLLANNFDSNKKYFENLLVSDVNGHDYLLEIIDICASIYLYRFETPGIDKKVEIEKGLEILSFFLNNTHISEGIESKRTFYLEKTLNRFEFISRFPFINKSYYYRKYFTENGSRRYPPLSSEELTRQIDLHQNNRNEILK